MSVLIITEKNDIHGHALIWALESIGVQCDRWSMLEFPDRQRSSVRISNQPCNLSTDCKISGISSSYTSIWLRRLNSPGSISSKLADADVKMARLEARRYAEGVRSIISPGSVWINPRATRSFSTSKPYQLRMAKEAGFMIPETLFSNDPDEIRSFYREQKGNVIYKPFAPAFWEDRSSGRLRGVFTSKLSDDLLAGDDASFTSCPGIYQQYIEKRAELRVTFFGSEYHSSRIYSQQAAAGVVDYRSDMKGEAPMEAAVLSPLLLEKCKAFVAKLGLLHGSFDFIECSDGSVVFLEINEMGQFLWLEERVPEMPMLALFAAFSLEPSPGFILDAKRRLPVSFHDFLRSEAYLRFRQDLAEYANSSDLAKPFYFSE